MCSFLLLQGLLTNCHFASFGPYQVEAKVGTVAYRLTLPPASNVYPVFHVSLLKKVTGTRPPLVSVLPTDASTVNVLELVLDKRLKQRNCRVIHQVLVKWSGLLVEMATWEDENEIRHLLPNDTAYREAVISGGGGVMNAATAGSDKNIEEEKQARPKREGKPNTRVSGRTGCKSETGP